MISVTESIRLCPCPTCNEILTFSEDDIESASRYVFDENPNLATFAEMERMLQVLKSRRDGTKLPALVDTVEVPREGLLVSDYFYVVLHGKTGNIPASIVSGKQVLTIFETMELADKYLAYCNSLDSPDLQRGALEVQRMRTATLWLIFQNDAEWLALVGEKKVEIVQNINPEAIRGHVAHIAEVVGVKL